MRLIDGVTETKRKTDDYFFGGKPTTGDAMWFYGPFALGFAVASVVAGVVCFG